ncbi:Os06g0589900 [Oryza sativa Japonica Group]|uniref:Os06g0589900 protein n=1 Tax=Oryza sativa subsp. japonica TaxID=39947 RepID=Q69X92_ORYSJ|nr:unknown protein [Oryza sativa Japonica Group]BAF19879.1 Os06g0589900 [Oryza sativa Japonica Group]|eukprot:NP_001057965.1 Os06g0589900 [Oryza sativa Japonica Group]
MSGCWEIFPHSSGEHFTSLRKATTSFMVGRSAGAGFTQKMAIPSVCSISWTSWSGMPRSFGSRMFTAGS